MRAERSEAADRAAITARFRRFADAFGDLALYHRFALGCVDDPEVAGLLLAAPPGQARPVLLFAAVHDLVLRRPELPLARWYPTVTARDELAGGDPWPVFRATCLEHGDELREMIATRTTQTNEVNRAVLVAVLVSAACRDVPDRPVSFVELGASAGLLSGADRYRIDIGGTVVGDPDSPVHLSGEVRGPGRLDVRGFPPRIIDRVGIDEDPVDLSDVDRRRWLEACLWPDQPWRVERFRAAAELLGEDPPRLVTGDLVDDLGAVLGSVDAGSHVVVFDTWALTYVARERRPLVAAGLAAFAASGRAVSWVSAEPPGCVPGVDPPSWVAGSEEADPDTVLGVRRWRDGSELAPAALGWSHPHGDWVDLLR